MGNVVCRPNLVEAADSWAIRKCEQPVQIQYVSPCESEEAPVQTVTQRFVESLLEIGMNCDADDDVVRTTRPDVQMSSRRRVSWNRVCRPTASACLRGPEL